MRWILLRGLGRESEHWDGFPGKLQLHGHETECLDLPGAGTEFRRPAPLSIKETVADLRARRQPSDEPVGIIAISLGGMVALDWAARYPDEISQLVIINSSVSGLSPPWKRLRLQSLPTGFKFITARTSQEKELATLQMTTGFSGAELERKTIHWAGIRDQKPVSTAAIFRQLFAAFRFRLGVLPKCPALVIKGERDRLVDPVCSDLIARKLGAKLIAHPTAGHDLPVEEPDWLAECIAEWSADIKSSKPRV